MFWGRERAGPSGPAQLQICTELGFSIGRVSVSSELRAQGMAGIGLSAQLRPWGPLGAGEWGWRPDTVCWPMPWD